jgi:hypothetical protein
VIIEKLEVSLETKSEKIQSSQANGKLYMNPPEIKLKGDFKPIWSTRAHYEIIKSLEFVQEE